MKPISDMTDTELLQLALDEVEGRLGFAMGYRGYWRDKPQSKVRDCVLSHLDVHIFDLETIQEVLSRTAGIGQLIYGGPAYVARQEAAQ